MNKLALACVVLGVVVSGPRVLGQDRRWVPEALQADAAARRVALVIGNDSYSSQNRLYNARNDARAVAKKLESLSFEVTTVEDANAESMRAALVAFGQRLTSQDLAFVFYAGHGVQVEGQNYLIPVDFMGQSAEDVRSAAVSSDVAIRATAGAGTRVVVLDACRDNPYSGPRSAGKGLAVHQEEPGVLIAFAAGAGETSSDAPSQANGRYTSELLQVLGSPGLNLVDTFHDVQQRVYASSQGRQFPAVYSKLVGDVVLTPALPVGAKLDAELVLWNTIKDTDAPAPFEDYLARYPKGKFRALAAGRVPDREFVLKARLDKQSYRSGEQVGLTVESSKDAALYLIDVTPDGGASLVPLGPKSGPTRLRAQQRFDFPSAEERRKGDGLNLFADKPSQEQFWFVAFREGVGHEGWLSRADIPEAAGSVPLKDGTVAAVRDALRRFDRREWTMTQIEFDIQP